MKKFYFLLIAIMVTSLSFGQGPVITMIADGDCSGGNPKVLEIYANGTVDFTLYSLENQTNGNTSWGNSLDLSALGSVTDSFVYIYKESTAFFATEYASVATNALEDTGSTMNVNGDDRVRIVETASSTVIDQYGVEGADGSGTTWEYKDGYGKRNANTSPNAGAFNDANWTNGNDLLNGFGTCQGGDTFESIIGLGTYTPPTGVQTPTLAIVTPSEGSTTPSGDVTVNYAIANFNVDTAGNGDGHFHWQLDGGASTPVYSNDGTLSFTGLTTGSHTLFLDLRDDAHASLSPAVEATVTFTVQAYTQVDDVATLRAGTIDEYYELTGEAFINYAQSYRNQKWVQDATAGILIDDQPGNITVGIRTDGLSSIKGKLSEYQGLMQFVPSLDATLVSPSTLTIEPEIVTFAELSSNAENFEAKLVKVEGVTMADADGGDGNFANGTVYAMSQDADSFNFRTNFYGVDYITTALPTTTRTIVGLIAQNSDGHTFTARDLADFVDTASVDSNTIEGFNLYPNPTSGILNITTLSNKTKNVEIFTIIGKKVLSKSYSEAQFKVDVTNLNAGLYIIKVKAGDSTSIQKVVIK